MNNTCTMARELGLAAARALWVILLCNKFVCLTAMLQVSLVPCGSMGATTAFYLLTFIYLLSHACLTFCM